MRNRLKVRDLIEELMKEDPDAEINVQVTTNYSGTPAVFQTMGIYQLMISEEGFNYEDPKGKTPYRVLLRVITPSKRISSDRYVIPAD